MRAVTYLLTDRPDLRIVHDELWRAVQTRLAGLKAHYSHFTTVRVESKYLLSGLMRCEHCGGSMVGTTVSVGSPGKRRRSRRYACSYANSRGATVCTNNLKPVIETLDDQVLEAIETTVLTPTAIRRVLELVLEHAKSARRPDMRQKRDVEIEARKIRQELDRRQKSTRRH